MSYRLRIPRDPAGRFETVPLRTALELERQLTAFAASAASRHGGPHSAEASGYRVWFRVDHLARELVLVAVERAPELAATAQLSS